MSQLQNLKVEPSGIVSRAWYFMGVLLLCCASALFPIDGWADSQRELALEQMTDLADEIVVGKVTSSVPRWQGRLIVTVSTIEVIESIKGQIGLTMEITQLGGTAVHPRLKVPVHMSASGSAVLNPGEEVLLFVRRAKGGIRDLIGGPQGKLVVKVDPVTGDKIIPIGNKEISGTDEKGRRTITAGETTLNEIRRKIKDHIQRGSKAIKSGDEKK